MQNCKKVPLQLYRNLIAKTLLVSCFFLVVGMTAEAIAQEDQLESLETELSQGEEAVIYKTTNAQNILQTVVTLGVRHSQNLKIGTASANASRYDFYGAASNLMPRLSLSYNIGQQTYRRTDMSNSAAAPTDTTRGTSAVSAAVTMPFFTGFQNVNQLRASVAGMRASEAQFRETVSGTIFGVVATYYQTLQSKEKMNLAINHLRQMYKLREQLASKIRTDPGLRGTRYQADKRIALLEDEVAAARGDLVNNRARLALQIKDLPSQAMVVPAEVRLERLPESKQEAIALAMRNKASITAAQEQAAQQRYASYVTLGAMAPQVEGSFSWSEDNNLSGTTDKINDTRVGINISENINLFLAEMQTYRAAASRRIAARQQAFLSQDQGRAAVSIAWEDFSAKQTRQRAVNRFLEATISGYDIVNSQFKAGKSSFGSLIEAQFELYNARVRALGARVDNDISFYRVLQETGTIADYYSYGDTDKVRETIAQRR